MENILTLRPVSQQVVKANVDTGISTVSTNSPIIVANTVEGNFNEIKNNHIIPVFVKDNSTLISHYDFIDVTAEIAATVFSGEKLLSPSIRLSHPIKGRIPDARDKPAHLLQEHEKTLYYERMAFAIEIPTIHEDIDGNTLSLTVGGVKAYSQDNLSARKGADEHFKIYIGFQNRVCTNLCVSTDGFMNDVKVSSLGHLKACLTTLFENYNASYSLHTLKDFAQYSVREEQFAHLIGRCRMYPFLPKKLQAEIPQLLFGDTQLGMVVRDYYRDESFCKGSDGNINLWKMYNLFTGANKSTYIDMFLERSVNAFQFIHGLKDALRLGGNNWYLS
ncbi:hypothetical protein CAP36_07895 [Chitinophagaceae bacterium IBVUCB2]|nr:hypothetical protein CAP36_07895 [Chitinophagaceae bacterium IBVUCB2]